MSQVAELCEAGFWEVQGPGGVLRFPQDDDLGRAIAMLVEGETSGRALDEVLLRYGQSRSTYYRKLQQFRRGGAKGLVPESPGPRNPWRRTHEVLRFIVQARLRDPRRSAESIADELIRRGAQVSARSVERTLSEFGITHAAAAPAVPAP